MKLFFCVILAWSCTLSNALAVDASVTFNDGIYTIQSSFIVNAKPSRVMSILTDYENLKALSPTIQSSEIIQSPGKGFTRIRTVVKDCVIFFCKQIVRVEDMKKVSELKLESYIVPMMSDLRSGDASWELKFEDNGTRINYLATVEPKFWIPPFIRSVVLTNKFKKRIKESVKLIQKIAQNEE